MSSWFVKLHLFLARHRLVVCLLTLCFLALTAWLGSRLRLSEDYTEMLPVSVPAIAEQARALRYLRQAERLYIDVQTTAPNAGMLADAAMRMHGALAQFPALTDIRDEVDAGDMRDVYAQLQSQVPEMLSSNDLAALEPRQQTEALTKRLAWLKDAMNQPQGMMLPEVARNDPVGLADSVFARLRELRAGTADAQIVAGRITSADGCHVLLSATPSFRSSDVAQSAKLIEPLLNAARTVESQFTSNSVRISITGAHRSALDNATVIRKDSTRASVVATVMVAALLFAAHRRRVLSLLGLLPTLMGAAGAIVAFALGGGVVSAVALGCGSMLIGVTVDYGICILYQLDDLAPGNREDLARAVAQWVPSLAFGALTTMAAFLVMLLSPVSGHRQLGIFGAVGVSAAALFAVFVLPLIIPLQSSRQQPTLPLTRLMRRFSDWQVGHSRLTAVVALLFSALCVVGFCRLGFDGDFARLNGVTADTARDEAAIRAVWGKSMSVTMIVVRGAKLEESLEKNERLYAALREFRQTNGIESFASIAPLMPSEQRRLQNRQSWEAYWNADRRNVLAGNLATAGSGLGFRKTAFQKFIDRLGASAEPSGSAAFDTHSPLARLATDFWTEQDGSISFITMAKVDREQFRRLSQVVKAAVPDALLLNKTALADEIATTARRGLPIFGVAVAALNALLLFLLLGDAALVLITMLPMAVGIFWTLGCLGLLGLPIDMSNFIFVIFVVGVGGDYSLFLVLAELEPLRGGHERSAAAAGAVAICALTSLFGFGVLVIAHHPALFSVGLTALLGISFSLLATYFMVPACVRWLGRRCTTVPAASTLQSFTTSQKRKLISRLYRLQGPYVSRFVLWKMRIDPLFQSLEQTVPRNGRILDLGCGFGMAAHWLTLFSTDRTVLGVDMDSGKLRAAASTQSANPRVSFEQRDIIEWPRLPDCDCVLLFDVLHYFPHDLKIQVLQKAFEALSPGGKLIVRDALSDGSGGHRRVAWAEKWAVRFGQNQTRHGLHFESRETLLDLLRKAGFSQIQINGDAGLGSNALVTACKN